jgi:hypothetical protein
MQREMKKFLEAGLTQYAKAKSTIAAFEDEVEDRLKAAVGKQRWSPLTSVKLGRPIPGGSSGGDGYWISMEITGRSQRHEDAVIDCGLWWNAPDISEPIIYADFFNQPKRVTNFPWDGNKKGIGSFKRWDRTHLYLPIPRSLEIADPLNRLLDALLKQLR